MTLFRNYIKRIVDFSFSTIVLILTLPVLVVLPFFIKLNSKGPVLFKQTRLGKGEKLFTLYKFRTMIDDAEKDTGPVWSQEGDFRITRLGAFMRKTRLDEIPQLFNVLRGDMSFIGPRPERPFFVDSLKKQIPYYSERHCVKPGITGWAQVNGYRGQTETREKMALRIEHDLWYIQNWSLWLDLKILLMTPFVMIHKNAY